MKALIGDVMYATLYRFTSSISHASELGAHFEVDPASDDLIWKIEPQVRWGEIPSYTARELFWHAANRIDHRLGLGYAATLAPHRLTRSDVEKGALNLTNRLSRINRRSWYVQSSPKWSGYLSSKSVLLFHSLFNAPLAPADCTHPVFCVIQGQSRKIAPHWHRQKNIYTPSTCPLSRP